MTGSKNRKIILVISIVFFFGIIGLGLYLNFPSPSPSFPAKRHVAYSFTLENTTGRLVERAGLWAHAPVSMTPVQKCIRISATHPYRKLTDDQGNQVLRFVFKDITPYAARIVNVQAELSFSDDPNRVRLEDKTPFLQPREYCECDNPEILRLAEKLRARDPKKTAENIFRWVSANVQNTGYLRNPRGALYALRHKRGDCTEFMYLFAALCRAAEIPARCIAGYACGNNAVLKPSGYHNWAEFYYRGTWHIADPQRKIFMQDQSGYIAIYLMGKRNGFPIEGHRLFKYTGNGIRVRMNS